MLRFENLTLRRGGRILFSGASLMVHPGQSVGVTGANGSGKTSLFALVRDEIQPDEGSFRRPRDWVISHVAQETPSDTRPAIEYVLDGDSALRAIQRAIVDAESRDDGAQLAELHERLELADGYSARARASRLIDGLGFKAGEEEHSVDSFSGGWRMRLNLARALMCRSDLLLLDEPTNHLDLDAVIWLEAWLKSYPGTLLLISHDRDFLDSVSNHIAHIEQEQVTLYPGNYSAFERVRAERLANQHAAFERQQREIAHIHKFVERFRAKATKARQAQSRVKALERMELIAPAHVDSPFRFGFFTPEKIPNPLLRLETASVGYGDRAVIQGVDLVLSPGDRIGLLGPNGAGKSTLIKLLAGEISLWSGERAEAQDLNLGYFAQHQVDQLHPEHTPLEHLQQLDPESSEQSLRDYLGGFGFSGERADTQIAPFSGGEKSRLVLAMLIRRRPNLLLLDEPTNHLDLEMRQALSQALQEYVGAMVIVSHDRHLLRTTVDRLLLVSDGGSEEFKGDLDDYPRWLIDHQRGAVVESETASVARHSSVGRKERKREEAEHRRKLQPLKRAMERLEKELERLQDEQVRLEGLLTEPEIYDGENKAQLKQLLAEQAANEKKLTSTEENWLQAVEQYEAARV